MRLRDILDWNDKTREYIDEMLAKAAKYRQIVIFGAGIGGKQTFELLEQHGMSDRVMAFSDNSAEKQGNDYCGKPILRAEDACRDYSAALILISSTAFDTIKSQLMQLGAREEDIFFFQPAGISLQENQDKTFIEEHLAKFERVYELLADEESRSIYSSLLNYRITKDIKWLDTMRPMILEETDQYFDKRLLNHYDFDGAFVDAGAYTGDTLESFRRNFPDWRGKYYCIEAGRESYKILCDAVRRTDDKIEVIPINKAVWDCEGELYFDTENYNNGAGSRVSDSGERVLCCSIDGISVRGGEIGFIKMDIEGAEKKALLGAKNTIVKCKPILTVCIYHKPEDFFDIPLVLEEMVSGEYEYYVRQYRYGQSETVLYALPKSRKKH